MRHRTFRRAWSALAAATLLGCGGGPPPDVAAPDPGLAAERAAASISAGSVLRHVTFLASDELRGRDTPSPGLEAAAEYIARRFESAGLQPAGEDGGWLQRWSYEELRFDRAASVLRMEGPGGGTSLSLGEQWFALPSEVEAVRGRPLFVGSTEALSDGFPPATAGRIAVVSTGPSLGMETLALARGAAGAGAEGLVLLLHPLIPPEAIPAILAQVEGLPPQPIPVAGVLHAGGRELLAAGGIRIDELLAETPIGPLSGEANGEMEITVAVHRNSARPPNVVGLLRGSDPGLRDEFVLYTAHFDHVGTGVADAEGDSIYNGADDDASGTALLIEVARAFAALPEAPPRSVLFLAVSGEEKGLLGSRWWADHPTVPIERVVANLNFDMVGRNHPDTVVVLGQEHSSLGPLARRVAARPDVRLVTAPDPDPSEQAFLRSDHVSFLRHDVPALFLTTWLHEDYHRPSDEVAGIDAGKLARITRLAFWLGLEIAVEARVPRWNEGAREEVRRQLEGLPF